MSQYIALRLRKLPTIYWVVKPDDLNFEAPQDLVVTTQQGCEVGRAMRVVDIKPSEARDEGDPFVVEILRLVNAEDREKLAELKVREKEAFLQARDKIQHHQLCMKLLKAEYLFDYSRLVLYFKSESKVDFRDLLKSLAGIFKTRIELRQIGVRDETKLLGGIGCCGKEVCCAQFMNAFYPVSTKMAKEQNLSLNPAKLSGICGRLLCCLAHEHEYYASFHGKYPKLGAEVVIGSEIARVMDINYITCRITLSFADRRKAQHDLEQIKGRKDQATGRNLWWVNLPDQAEPDLSLLLKNLNPPGTGKKKKKADGAPRNSEDDAPAGDSDDRGEARPPRPDNRGGRERSGRPERSDRPSPADRQDRPARPERSDRSDRQDNRPDRSERRDRSERPGQGGREPLDSNRDEKPDNDQG